MLSKKATRRTGITHFPLQEEKISQRELPPRGKKKWGASQTTRSGKRGHRLSRKAGRSATLSSENEFKGSRGKGGKTGGSCAGLLATRKEFKKEISQLSVIFCTLPKTTTQPGFVRVYEAYSPRNVARCPARFRRCLTHRNGVARRYFIA